MYIFPQLSQFSPRLSIISKSVIGLLREFGLVRVRQWWVVSPELGKGIALVPQLQPKVWSPITNKEEATWSASESKQEAELENKKRQDGELRGWTEHD